MSYHVRTRTHAPTLARVRARAAFAFALLLAPLSLDAQQPSSGAAEIDSLSLDQAIRLAVENNPLFLQQKNDIELARSSVRAAYGGLAPNASISSGFGYTASGERRFGSVEFGRQPDYYSSDYAIGMNYEVSGSTLLRPSVQRSQKRATERRVSGADANLRAQVSQQYLAVLRERERVAQAEKEIARASEYVRLAEARLAVGAGTPLDVRRAEVTKGRAEVTLVQARNGAAIAALTLGQVIGIPLDDSVRLTSRFAVFEPGLEPDALVQAALANNPNLLAARASSEAAQTGVRSARSAYLPSLNFNVGLRGSVYQAGSIEPFVEQGVSGAQRQFQACQQGNQLGQLIGQAATDCSRFDVNNPAVIQGIRSEQESRNNGFPFNYTRQPLSASMVVSLPIFTGFGRELQVDQARAAAADARQQIRAEELRLRQEVGAGVHNLETAHQTVRLQERVRANSEEELRMAQERFRFGAASSIEVTDAQANLAQAEQALIDAIYTFHQTLAQLESLVGRSLRTQ